MISRAENEVDSLEIVVETEANRASRTLTSIEKKALKVADALDKCAKSAHGLDFTGIAGLSELIDVKNTFKDILKEQKAIRYCQRSAGFCLQRTDYASKWKSIYPRG